jgi:hypothetical protein
VEAVASASGQWCLQRMSSLLGSKDLETAQCLTLIVGNLVVAPPASSLLP